MNNTINENYKKNSNNITVNWVESEFIPILNELKYNIEIAIPNLNNQVDRDGMFYELNMINQKIGGMIQITNNNKPYFLNINQTNETKNVNPQQVTEVYGKINGIAERMIGLLTTQLNIIRRETPSDILKATPSATNNPPSQELCNDFYTLMYSDQLNPNSNYMKNPNNKFSIGTYDYYNEKCQPFLQKYVENKLTPNITPAPYGNNEVYPVTNYTNKLTPNITPAPYGNNATLSSTMNEVYPVTNYTNTPTPTDANFKINTQFDKAPLPEIPRYDGNINWCIKTTNQLTENIIKPEELGDKYNSYLEICPNYGPVFTPSPFTTTSRTNTSTPFTTTSRTNTSTPFTTTTAKTNTSTPFTTTSRTNTSTPFTTTTARTNTSTPLRRKIQNDKFYELNSKHTANIQKYNTFNNDNKTNATLNTLKNSLRNEAEKMNELLETYKNFAKNKNEYADLLKNMNLEDVQQTLRIINRTTLNKYVSDDIQTRMNTHFNNIQNFSAQLN